MDVFDKLALSMRRYEPRTTLRAHDKRFELMDLMELYSREAILELTALSQDVPALTRRPDETRKLKVSLLDSVSDLHLPADAWFSVSQTAPSGDFSKVLIKAYGRGHEPLGVIKLLIGRRNYAYYFSQDPVLDQIDTETPAAPAAAT